MYLFSFQLLLQFTHSHGGALQLNKDNFDSIIGKRNRYILIPYATWVCLEIFHINFSVTVMEQRQIRACFNFFYL